MSNEDLLRPTLSDHERVPGLYNSTGFFMSSFFGGPLGAAVYGGANSHRLGRLQKDLPLLIGLVAVAFMLPYVLQEAGWLQGLAESVRRLDHAQLRTRHARARDWPPTALSTSCTGDFSDRRRVSGAKEVSRLDPGHRRRTAAGVAANAAFVTWLLKHH